MSVRHLVFGLLLVTSTACSPSVRANVGATMAGVGLLTSEAAVEAMATSNCRRYADADRDRHYCTEYSKPTSPSLGGPIAAGGLGVALLGGLLWVSGLEAPLAPSHTPEAQDAPPDQPTSLTEVDAVGMAVAELVLNGVDGDAKPSKLLEVNDAQSRLFVNEARAELRNLRVHKVDDTWSTLFACYAYEGGWQLKSLSRIPGCAP